MAWKADGFETTNPKPFDSGSLFSACKEFPNFCGPSPNLSVLFGEDYDCVLNGPRKSLSLRALRFRRESRKTHGLACHLRLRKKILVAVTVKHEPSVFGRVSDHVIRQSDRSRPAIDAPYLKCFSIRARVNHGDRVPARRQVLRSDVESERDIRYDFLVGGGLRVRADGESTYDDDHRYGYVQISVQVGPPVSVLCLSLSGNAHELARFPHDSETFVVNFVAIRDGHL